MFRDRWRGRDGRTSVKVCGDRIRGWSTKNEEDGILRMIDEERYTIDSIS